MMMMMILNRPMYGFFQFDRCENIEIAFDRSCGCKLVLVSAVEGIV